MSVARSSESWRGGRSRIAPSSLAAVVVLAAVILLAFWMLIPGQALAAIDYQTLTGTDRYQTAILVSGAGFAPGVEAVVVASGESYQGALCAAPLAAAYGGPVLLTGSAALDPRTQAEIGRLTPGKIFVVGLGSPVVDQLAAAFPDLAASSSIVSIVGADDYEMAKLVSEQVAAKLGVVTGVVLVPGDKFPDAIAVSPLAAEKGWPILLTPAAGPLPDMTTQAFTALGVTAVLEAGTYVDPGIAGATLTRFVGSDRYATAALIAEYAQTQGLSYAHVAFVTGDNFPDALAAGPYLAVDAGIALLLRQTSVPPATSTLFGAHKDEITAVDFIGLPTGTANVVKLLLGTTGLPADFNFPTLSWGSKGAEVTWLEQRLTDLSYRPGPIDGVFDKRTYQAVIAFQKWEWLPRTGTVGKATWERLLAATRPVPTHSLSGTWLEVNKSKQVLLFCQDGAVVRTLPTSTGSPNVGIITPSGTHMVYRENTWERVRYKPLYLRPWGVLAIHGYPSVPVYPASHGCVRIPIWDMDELHALVPVGTKVYIY